MAEDRLTISTLRRVVAQTTNRSEAEAGAFVEALLQSLTAGLTTDGTVRISGLGTFRRQAVEARDSIDIRTGERITIKGYQKVNFTADNQLKEKINQPFAHLNSILLDADGNPMPTNEDFNPIARLGEQAAEIKDLLAEIQDPIPLITPTIEQPTLPIIEQATPPTNNQIIEQSTLPIIEQSTIPTIEQTNTPTTKQTNTPTTKQTTTSTFHPVRVALITVLCFCLVLVGAYFFLQYKLTRWADSLLEGNEKKEKTEQIVPQKGVAPEYPVSPEYLENPESPEPPVPIESSASPEPPAPPTTASPQPSDPFSFTEYIATATVNEGSRLSWLSRKYYGKPDYWVYIYLANKDIIKDANNIPVGTQLRIPKLPAEWTDPLNEQYRKQADDLQAQILSK